MIDAEDICQCADPCEYHLDEESVSELAFCPRLNRKARPRPPRVLSIFSSAYSRPCRHRLASMKGKRQALTPFIPNSSAQSVESRHPRSDSRFSSLSGKNGKKRVASQAVRIMVLSVNTPTKSLSHRRPGRHFALIDATPEFAERIFGVGSLQP